MSRCFIVEKTGSYANDKNQVRSRDRAALFDLIKFGNENVKQSYCREPICVTTEQNNLQTQLSYINHHRMTPVTKVTHKPLLALTCELPVI